MRKGMPARRSWTWIWRSVDRQGIAVLTAMAALALTVGATTQRWSLVPAPDAPTPLLFQLDIHSAPWPECTLLPGIGEGLAKRICAERDRSGGFRSLEEVRKVRGIGPKTWRRIQPHLTSSTPPPDSPPPNSPNSSEQGT